MEVELRIGKKCESVSDVEFVARKERCLLYCACEMIPGMEDQSG